MPAGDGSGPRGEGPLTGRAMGRCAGYPAGGYATTQGRGGGYGFFGRRGGRGGYGFYGRGGGRGFRNRYYEPAFRENYPVDNSYLYNREQPSETESLKNQVQFVADTIEQIASRVNQLLKRKTEKE